MSVKIIGSTSGNVAEVNAQNEVRTALSKTPANVGHVGLQSVNDPGTATGSTLQLRSPRTSVDQRLAVGVDTQLDADVFNYTAQATGKSINSQTSQTIGFSSNFLQLNSGGAVAANSGSYYLTRQFFTLQNEGSLIAEIIAQFTAPTATNTEVYLGWYNQSSPTTLPLDGVYFKIAATGVIGVINNNGTETPSGTFSGLTLAVNTAYKFRIIINNRQAEFYVNDVLYAVVAVPAVNPNITTTPSLPLGFQHRITASAASVANITRVSSYGIWAAESTGNKDYLTIKTIQNGGAYQGTQGMTQGSTANYGNNQNPTAAAATNTTAALGTGLGGQFYETDTLAVDTDGIISSYQVPAWSLTVPAKTMLVHSVTVDSYVATALVGGGYNSQWSIAFGHTAVSLATAEGAGTKAPRRIALGANAVAAAAVALTQLTTITRTFRTPIVVNPGEFFAVVKKKKGAAPTAGQINHVITVDATFVD